MDGADKRALLPGDRCPHDTNNAGRSSRKDSNVGECRYPVMDLRKRAGRGREGGKEGGCTTATYVYRRERDSTGN